MHTMKQEFEGVGPCQSSGRSGQSSVQGGFAIVTVLMVLLGLLVLSAPFLMTARNASRASSNLSDQAQKRLALDSAVRRALGRLGDSHPAIDGTPYFDGVDEISVDNAFPEGFWNASNPNGVMWDVDVHDVAARIDLNSANPQVFANMMKLAGRLTEDVTGKDVRLPISGSREFDPKGFVVIGGELIGYQAVDGGELQECVRGLAAPVDEEGKFLPCGPRPPQSHGFGTPVLDQRCFAPVIWRTMTPDGTLRGFDATEQVRDASNFALAGSMGDKNLAQLRRMGTVYGGLRAGARWSRAVRVTNSIQGGQDCGLRVEGGRYFNEGCTVQISDGQRTEIAIVQRVTGAGIQLDNSLVNDYAPYTSWVRVLIKRPVNINIASREVLIALFANLQRRRINSRITGREAEDLADAVIESRPFEGLEDFARRIVLPAAGLEVLPGDAPAIPEALAGDSSILDSPQDAMALLVNAINANDSSLSFSTMPFSFVSRDVYELDARAMVNAQSGIARASATRNQVSMVVPQRELLQLWTRQEDFEEMLRLDREAPGWASGPHALVRPDGRENPPSRFWAHMGTYAGAPYVDGLTRLQNVDPSSPPSAERVFASREQDPVGFMQLWASRVEESGRRQGRMLHFDHETREPEGRYLPDQTILRAARDGVVGYVDQGANGLATGSGLLRPIEFSGWFQPRSLRDGVLFDVGSNSLEADRVTLRLEGGDLVLRVMDGAADHPDSVFDEFGEVRFAVAAGEGPGLQVNTWSHVHLEVTGNRPDQMHLAIDGQTFGVRTPGLTHLTAPLAGDQSTIQVESTDGFPARCTIRIADEVIEVEVTGSTTFTASPTVTGANASYGGRLAREFVVPQGNGQPALNQGLASRITDHGAMTPVQLYGYSNPVSDNVPAGEAALGGQLGLFSAGIVTEVEVPGTSQTGEPISIEIQGGQLQLGLGIEGYNSEAVSITLAPAELGVTPEQLMSGFNASGGYALLMQGGTQNTFQVPIDPSDPSAGTQTIPASNLRTVQNSPVFGWEIIRYASVQGMTLTLAPNGRGDTHGWQNPGAEQAPERRAFVTQWTLPVSGGGQFPVPGDLEWSPMVIPISVFAPGADANLSFLPAADGFSELAQITHLDQAELTEWVRYDEIRNGHLVRNSEVALREAQRVAFPSRARRVNVGQQPGGGGGGIPPAPTALAATPGAPPSPAAPASQQASGSYWVDDLGQWEESYETRPISKTIASHLQFRGALGTYIHTHPNGTPVLPVFRIRGGGPDRGHPGRLDEAFLMSTDPQEPSWPVIVHYARQPSLAHETYDFQIDPMDPTQATFAAVSNGVAPQVGIRQGDIYVGLQQRAPVPIIGNQSAQSQGLNTLDTRLVARLVKFPSGELPRSASVVTVGSSVRATEIPDAIVDELLFGSTDFGTQTGFGADTRGGHFVLSQPLTIGADTFEVARSSLRIPDSIYSEAGNDMLNHLPDDAGLMRIGNEIVCYDTLSPGTGVLVLAPGGRGLLGTEELNHERTEGMAFLDSWVVTQLSGAVAAGDGQLSIEDSEGFPEAGTVLVGDELIHYTRLRSGRLEMPLTSREPGRNDEGGTGLFRGRYGTRPQSHAIGTPVILFPFRYWDRWAEQADQPELHYMGISVDQPGAFHLGMFWDEEVSNSGLSEIAVLQRTRPEIPWDADPEETEGLDIIWDATSGGDFNPINVQTDRVEWRVFVNYSDGAFDSQFGLSHGWKETPRLRTFGATYLGPNMSWRRIDH